MKKIFLILTIFFSVPLFGDTTVIVTPTQKNVDALVDRITSNTFLTRHEFVFSPSERKALIDLGQRDVAHSLKLTLKNGKDLESFKTWIRIEKLPVRLEQNTMPVKMDEPLLDDQWGMNNQGKSQTMFFDQYRTLYLKGMQNEDVNAVSIKPKTSRQIVAVLDTGVDIHHRDLKNQIFRSEGECRALAEYKQCLKSPEKGQSAQDCHKKYGEMDTDGNGYPLDCSGWSFLDRGLNPMSQVPGSPEFKDARGHGTHVAGIIAAEKNNYGVEGCTQNALILPIKVIGDNPTGPMRPQETRPNSELPKIESKPVTPQEELADVIARGMLYAIRSKVNVINMSLGWPSARDSFLMRKMVQLAQAQSILVVAAAGNDSTDALIMPCLYPGVLCVGAHNPDGSISHFSNYGSGVNLVAPGFKILSTFPMGVNKVDAKIFTDLEGFEFKEGTSMAAPFASCAVAENLAQGHGPDETMARLMLGTRPTREILNPELKTRAIKYSLSGNLDIKQSLEVNSQPLILPVKKEPISLLWDGESTGISFSFALKNLWADAKNVKLRLSLVPQAGVSQKLRLDGSEKQFSLWREGQQQDFSSSLIVENVPFESEVLFDLSISAENMPEKRLRLQAIVATLVSSQFKNGTSQQFKINDFILNDQMSLRTVTNRTQVSTSQDYLVIEKLEKGQVLYLLKENNGSYNLGAKSTMGLVEGGALATILKMDINSDKVDDYILIYQLEKTKEIKRFRYSFFTFDKDLKPLELPFESGAKANFLYESDLSPFPEDFQWVKNGNYLLPAWVSTGLLPKSTKLDPWKLEPEQTLQTRIYAMTFKDLSIVSEVGDYNLAQKLNQSPEQKAKGIMPVLLNKGEDYVREYAIGEYFDGKVLNIVPLNFENYRMLVGEKNSTIIPLSQNSEFSGTSFMTRSYGGQVRMTWLNSAGVSLDRMLSPVNTADSVVHIIATFSGPHVRAAFTQTNSEMQYHDLVSGRVELTSLNRYSFMPTATFALTTSPIISWSNALSAKMPGVQVPAGFGLSESSIVIVPVYTQDGELIRLSRPASLRFLAGKGCEAMGDPVQSGESSPSQLVFYCGDKFIRVPLSY